MGKINLFVPGQKVKVKVKINDQLVSAMVERCRFISKFSFDCLYYFATDLRLVESNQLPS